MKIDRRAFVQGLTATGVLASSGASGALAAGTRMPNIIFILADDMGYADVSAYGTHVKTPNIDTLARDGALLTQGYASSAICSATRTALATGCYQQRFAVGLEEPVGPAAPADIGIPADRPTIASVMRDRGYRTALVGKWHLGDPPHHGPMQHGYDTYFGLIQGAADYFRHVVDLSGKAAVDGLYRDDKKVQEHGYLTDLFGDEAVRLIEQPSDKPLFLSLHFNAPHWPWEGPEDEAVSKALKDIFDRSGGSLETYAKMVGSMDANIGKVLAALKAKGMEENTIVVFTSDNGGERFSDTWPFTGVKGELLEGGLRVPLLFRWPARIKAGSVCDQVMTSMDFLPTLLSAAGGNPMKAGSFDGEDLLPVLTGAVPPHPRTLFWRFKASEQAAVRQGDWKYLKLGGKEHLFNVVADQRERAELAGEYPDKFAELKRLYAVWNAQMLPYPAKSFSEEVKKSYPDRY